MYVGKLVVPGGSTRLRSGAEAYACAVVVCVNPPKLTSLDADMLWSVNVDKMTLYPIAEAHPRYIRDGQQRLEAHERALEILTIMRRVFGFPHKREQIPVAKSRPDVTYMLGFVGTPEIRDLFPEFAAVLPTYKFDLFYDSTSNQCYLRRDWQTWAIPLGEAYDYAWYEELLRKVRSRQVPVYYQHTP